MHADQRRKWLITCQHASSLCSVGIHLQTRAVCAMRIMLYTCTCDKQGQARPTEPLKTLCSQACQLACKLLSHGSRPLHNRPLCRLHTAIDSGSADEIFLASQNHTFVLLADSIVALLGRCPVLSMRHPVRPKCLSICPYSVCSVGCRRKGGGNCRSFLAAAGFFGHCAGQAACTLPRQAPSA